MSDDGFVPSVLVEAWSRGDVTRREAGEALGRHVGFGELSGAVRELGLPLPLPPPQPRAERPSLAVRLIAAAAETRTLHQTMLRPPALTQMA